jgi:hypothetical protein
MTDSALRLAENTALLQKTCHKPIKPTHNVLSTAGNDSSRSLSMKDELDIVSCLSYLSTYSNHPDLVMALCIEERTDHRGLVISIATNKGAVSGLRRSMCGIVEVLEKQALGWYSVGQTFATTSDSVRCQNRLHRTFSR